MTDMFPSTGSTCRSPTPRPVSNRRSATSCPPRLPARLPDIGNGRTGHASSLPPDTTSVREVAEARSTWSLEPPRPRDARASTGSSRERLSSLRGSGRGDLSPKPSPKAPMTPSCSPCLPFSPADRAVPPPRLPAGAVDPRRAGSCRRRGSCSTRPSPIGHRRGSHCPEGLQGTKPSRRRRPGCAE